MFIAFITLFLFTRIEYDPPVREQVDLIELNHVHQLDGSVRLSQFVYKRWKKTWCISPITGEKEYKWGFEVVDWRFLKDSKIPTRNWRVNNYKQSFYDKKSGCSREITTPSFIETHTYYDVEVEARKCLESKYRQSLINPKPMRVLHEEN